MIDDDDGADDLDELGADLWATLYYLTLRRAPRLLKEWGSCRICYLPATGAREFGGAVYAWCSTCRVRWRIEDALGGLLELEPPDPDDERAFLDLELLASCDELDPWPAEFPSPVAAADATIREEIPFMRRETSTTPTATLLDPWQGCPRSQGPSTDEFDRMPAHWEALQRPSKEDPSTTLAAILGGCIVTVFADWLATREPGYQHRVWEAARKNAELNLLLCRPPFSSPLTLIQDAFRLLLDYGDVLPSLRARRDSIDRLIEILETRRGERVASEVAS